MEFLNFLINMNNARVRPFPKSPTTEQSPHEKAPAIHNPDNIFPAERSMSHGLM